MPIQFPQPPVSAIDVAKRGVASVGKGPQVSFLRITPRTGETSSAAHIVFHLGLDDVRSSRGVDAARPVAWRFLDGGGAERPFAADVQFADPKASDAPNAGPFVFAGVNEGPFVDGFRAAVDRLRSDRELAERNLEGRLLQVPGAYVIALWLHEPGSEGDLFIPLAPVNRAFEAGRRYDRKEFEFVLQRAAAKIGTAPSERRGELGSEAP
jgi:hypothetical protein